MTVCFLVSPVKTSQIPFISPSITNHKFVSKGLTICTTCEQEGRHPFSRTVTCNRCHVYRINSEDNMAVMVISSNSHLCIGSTGPCSLLDCTIWGVRQIPFCECLYFQCVCLFCLKKSCPGTVLVSITALSGKPRGANKCHRAPLELTNTVKGFV